MTSITLPWPPSSLRVNSHKHWRSRQTGAKLYKSVCMIELREQGLGRIDCHHMHLTIRFCPPDKRRRDLDGMLSQVKWGIDAISDTIGLDDYHFGFTLIRGDPVKGGKVIVTLTEE